VLVRYRVDDLATRTGVSVDTIRYYQSLGLLPRPRRDGRHAWYDDGHVARLERIRDLKARGFPLAMVGRVLDGGLDSDEEALALALAGDDSPSGPLLTLRELAERTEVSLPLLEAIEREGFLGTSSQPDEAVYTAADAEAVRAGIALLEAGVPLSELMALARKQDAAMRAVAEEAVDLFARYVRDPIRGSVADPDEAARQMVGAMNAMLPATGALVGHHFRRRLLAAARERLTGNDAGGPASADERGRLQGTEAPGDQR
jgi:DNA-binding transcriptional MerR regulator